MEIIKNTLINPYSVEFPLTYLTEISSSYVKNSASELQHAFNYSY